MIALQDKAHKLAKGIDEAKERKPRGSITNQTIYESGQYQDLFKRRIRTKMFSTL